MSKQFRSFYWKRWHSLAGMIPVGFFIILHWYSNSFAAMGAAKYNYHFSQTLFNPWMLTLEIVFLYIPLAFHLILGLSFIFKAKYNFKTYSYLDNWRFMLQRLSGLGVALFIGAHFIMTRGHSWFAKDGWVNGMPKEGWYAHMQTAMQHNLTFAVYFLGILGAAYHLGNGLWTFFNTMGWSKGATAQAKMKIFSMAIIVLLIVMGLYPLFILRGIL